MADRRIHELEATRDLSRIWLHVDMDAFYAAVETLSSPTLKGKPIAVGNMSMICTANYEVYYVITFQFFSVLQSQLISWMFEKINLHTLYFFM